MLAFTNCTLLDGSVGMVPVPGSTVVVDREKILSVGKSGAALPEGCRVVDLGGRYLMPGLINLHVHLPGNGVPKDTSKQNKEAVAKLLKNSLTRLVLRKMCEGYAKTELLSGVTTIRTVGGLSNIDSQIRDRGADGKARVPRILSSNMAVSVPGGHMAGVLAYEALSAEDAARYVRLIAETKPDLIKLMITGGVLDAKVKGEPGVLRMPLEYVTAACAEAHSLGYRVAAHVESPEGVRTALLGGVDTIEHGAKMDEEIIRLFKERGAAEICTISPAVPLAKFDRSVSRATELTQFNGNIVFEGIVAGAKDALANGIPVGLGTDTACPFVTHYDMWRELQYFHEYVGVTRTFALYTATKRNAEIAGIDGVTGSVEPGKSADFLITEGNPIEDLSVLRTPWMVVLRGSVIARPKIKKVPEIEKELDKYI